MLDTTFMKESQEVARRFLRTVLIVDDRGFGRTDTSATAVEGPRSLDEAFGDEVDGETPSTMDVQPTPSKNGAHDLDGPAVIRAFGRQKLLATLVPVPEASVDEEIVADLADKADVLVIDWRIPPAEDGAYALSVMQKVLRNGDAQLRLVVIYSGNERPHEILRRIREELKLEGDEDSDELGLTSGSVRVVVLTKHGLGREATAARLVRQVKEEDLPDRIVEEFTHLTAGILRNVALESFAVLREQSYGVLAAFPRELDAAFITHRIQCAPPRAADGFAVDLVADEIVTLLHSTAVADRASEDSVKAWLAHYFKGHWETCIREASGKAGEIRAEMTASEVQRLVEQGIKNWAHSVHGKTSRPWKDGFHKSATEEIAKACGLPQPSTIDKRFSIVSTLAIRHSETSGGCVLTQGTIVESKGTYYLCLQPRCDSVRIPGDHPTSFVFVEAERRSSEFNLVTQDAREFVTLKLVPGAKKVRLFDFSGNGAGNVSASLRDGEPVFAAAGGREFRWIAQLKRGQAQRFANQFAANLARVGIDQFEWLRRKDT